MRETNLHEQDVFLTSAQAAKFLNVSIVTLKKLIQKGTIKTFKTPGGHYRIQRRELIKNIYED